MLICEIGKRVEQKPLNISYKEMKDPIVEKTYKSKFQIQAEQKEIVKEKFQVMGFGQLNAIYKDLEIRIAKEQALKAQPTPKTSRATAGATEKAGWGNGVLIVNELQKRRSRNNNDNNKNNKNSKRKQIGKPS